MGCFGGGSSGTSSTTVTERAPTAEEERLNRLQADYAQQTYPAAAETEKAALALAKQLVSGEQLPDQYQQLWGGISPDVTDKLVKQSLKDIAPQFQASGILDSGVAASISARTAADIRTASEEYNIGNKLSLLNLALSGSTAVQSPVLANAQSLYGSLISQGKTTQTASSITTDNNTFGRQFMGSFGQSLGSNLGSGTYGGKSYFGGN